VCAPDDEWRYHPKHVQHLSGTYRTICMLLHRWKLHNFVPFTAVLFRNRPSADSRRCQHAAVTLRHKMAAAPCRIQQHDDSYLFIPCIEHNTLCCGRSALCVLQANCRLTVRTVRLQTCAVNASRFRYNPILRLSLSTSVIRITLPKRRFNPNLRRRILVHLFTLGNSGVA
jgi:hypothetical protein